MDTDRWFYVEAGRAVGPVSRADLQHRGDTGLLGRDDLVWLEGMAGWERAVNIEGLIGPQARIPPAIATEVRYAGFWRRAAAMVIDNIIVFAATFSLGVFLGVIQAAVHAPHGTIQSLARGLGMLGGWIYWAGFESSPLQATLGKRMLGIQVTDLNGRRIDILRAAGRQLGKIVSLLTLGIGFIMAGFTQRKQALHDVMASCLVVRSTPRKATVAEYLSLPGEPWR